MTRCHGWSGGGAAGDGRHETEERSDEDEPHRTTVPKAAETSYSMNLVHGIGSSLSTIVERLLLVDTISGRLPLANPEA